MDWRQYIHTDFNIMMGKPVIIGTRIPVELILEKIAAGETYEQIIGAYPRLNRPKILAAVAFAAESLRSEVLYPVVAVWILWLLCGFVGS